MTNTAQNGSRTSPSASPEDPTSLTSIVTRTTIQNRRLTYLNRSGYLQNPAMQERLFPHLYEKLILRHQSRAELINAENASKARSLTNVLLDAGQHMEKIQQLRDRTDEERKRDGEKLDHERLVAEMTPKEILVDKDKSRVLLEKMMREKFLAGDDEEFDYETVDDNEEWDDWETLEEDFRAKYFDAETPDNEVEEGRKLSGETGVQDF